MMRSFWLFMFFLLSAQLSFGQTENTNAVQIIEQRGEVYLSFRYPPKYSINHFSKILSIDKVEANRQIFAYANANEFQKFLEYGIPYQLEKDAYALTNPQMATSMAAFMQSWDTYPTYEQYDSLMHKLANDYPDLCRFHSLGTLSSGRQILALQLGDSANMHQKEARFFYTSSMHGNELTSYVLMLQFADYLLSNYGQNAVVDSIMNNVEIWINPLANPDGAYYLGNNTLSGAKRYNDNLVDLNRNFPDPNKGPHPDGNSWQLETQIFMDFSDSMHFTMSANFHGGAEVMNYPWDTWSKLPADNAWWLYVCHQYADTAQAYSWLNYFIGPLAANGTGVVNGYQWYPVYGGRQDYMNYFHGCREVTVEISTDKIPAGSSLPVYWNANYRSMLSYLNQARYGISGVVTDSISGKPLAAKVFVNSHDIDSSHIRTNLPYGDYYRLIDVGTYSITYSAPHYYSKTITVNVQRDNLIKLNVALLPDYTSLYEPSALDFSIFPNPVSHMLYITSETPIKELRIVSVEGRLIKEWSITESDNLQLDISSIQKGVYILQIIGSDGNMGYKKLIIQ